MSTNFYMLNMQKLLLIAKSLHAKGYENLKIIPSLSSSGLYWRCSYVNAEASRDSEIVVSNWLHNYYNITAEEINISVQELTDMFIKGHEEFLMKCIGKNEDYKTWFQNILDILEKEELPYAFSDFFGPTNYWLTSFGKKIYLNQNEAIKFLSDSNNRFDYREIEDVIKLFYQNNGCRNDFKKDLIYIQTSFDEIANLWLENLDKIEKVNYIMIAEAPLWGCKKNYIYNPNTRFSQFLFKSDLEEILKIEIVDKKTFIKICNAIGLLIIDISPYAFNANDTRFNYRTLGKSNYKKLVEASLPFYFDKKIKMIRSKLSADVKVFFRYKRVKQNFENIIRKSLLENNIIKFLEEIEHISQTGGGINKSKLKEIINKE